jgi:hypothetical protein
LAFAVSSRNPYSAHHVNACRRLVSGKNPVRVLLRATLRRTPRVPGEPDPNVGYGRASVLSVERAQHLHSVRRVACVAGKRAAAEAISLSAIWQAGRAQARHGRPSRSWEGLS